MSFMRMGWTRTLTGVSDGKTRQVDGEKNDGERMLKGLF